MDHDIRESLAATLKQLEQLREQYDDWGEKLPEHAKEAREKALEAMGDMRNLLNESMYKAQQGAGEAQVQAHLGLVEAQDRLEAARQVMDDQFDRWLDESRTFMDEAELKSRLALMEAKDFWERRGQSLMDEFQQSQQTMQSMAMDAARDMQEQFSKWSALLGAQGKDR